MTEKLISLGFRFEFFNMNFYYKHRYKDVNSMIKQKCKSEFGQVLG